MLARRYRLHEKRSLARVRRRGAVVRGPLLTLHVARRGEGGVPKIAVVVGRRVSKRAVDRHRVARWIRESVRSELSHLPPKVDFIVSATAPNERYSFAAVFKEVLALLRRAGLLT